jgi:hypothetical protein
MKEGFVPRNKNFGLSTNLSGQMRPSPQYTQIQQPVQAQQSQTFKTNQNATILNKQT